MNAFQYVCVCVKVVGFFEARILRHIDLSTDLMQMAFQMHLPHAGTVIPVVHSKIT